MVKEKISRIDKWDQKMIIKEKTTYRTGNGHRKRDSPENREEIFANYTGRQGFFLSRLRKELHKLNIKNTDHSIISNPIMR